MEKVLPFGKNIPLIFAALDRLERLNGVYIENFSLKPGLLSKEDNEVKSNPSIETISFDLSIIGSQEQLLLFMDDLLKTAPLFNIQRASLTEADGFYKLNVSVTTYYQALLENLGKIDTELPVLTSEQQKALSFIESINVSALAFDENVFIASPAGSTGGSIFKL